MPIYSYQCGAGHTAELVRGYSVAAVLCEVCGGEATRKSVYKVAHTHPKFWGSDFQFTRDMQAAHDEAIGYKHEAIAAMQEEQANGFAL